VPVVWFEVPETTPVFPYTHIFPLRDWDKLDEWAEPTLGTKYTKSQPWQGPPDPCTCVGVQGSPEQWLNGVSYADYLRAPNPQGRMAGRGGLSCTAAVYFPAAISGKGQAAGESAIMVGGSLQGKGQIGE
jgi:hypothetical protein